MGTAQVAVQIARPATSYRLLGLGDGPGEIGLVAAAFALAPLLLAIPLGRFADRTRPGPLLVVGSGVQAVACLLLGVVASTGAIAAVTAVLGVGHLGVALGAQHLIARESGRGQYDHRFGLLTVAVSLGQLAGPLLAGALVSSGAGSLAAASTHAMFVAAGIAALATVSAVFADGRNTGARPVVDRIPVRDIVGIHGVATAIFASLAALSAADVITSYLPVVGESEGIDPAIVGALLAVRAAASIAARIGIGPIVRRLGRLRLLALSAVVSAVAVLGPALTTRPLVLGLLMAVAGYGLGFGQPLSMTMVVQRVPEHAAATALAVRLTGNRLGQVAVPTLAGVVAGASGVGAVFWLLGAMLLASAAAVQRLASRERAGPLPTRDDLEAESDEAKQLLTG